MAKRNNNAETSNTEIEEIELPAPDATTEAPTEVEAETEATTTEAPAEVEVKTEVPAAIEAPTEVEATVVGLAAENLEVRELDEQAQSFVKSILGQFFGSTLTDEHVALAVTGLAAGKLTTIAREAYTITLEVYDMSFRATIDEVNSAIGNRELLLILNYQLLNSRL